ncbi:MAG: TonB-dependent receptor [Bacteroidales bacterium]|nr:TonB-dependent receptor [Bacteroidales bacterium]
MKNRFLFLVLFALVNFAFGQESGTIRGQIIDSETGEELIGATVLVVGTIIGSATDLDGNYTIPNIEPGIYDAKCQYISYETQTIRTIEIKESETYILNIKLKPVSVGLEEIIVEAKTINRTEAAILTMQKKSATVIDGISAQQISKTGDSDAAGALGRVTGVSVEDGKYVYVRGLSDRYTNTLLNGASIPGLDPNRNTVQLDLFPANLIENMIVYKTFSPDLPGSFTGGLVDLYTRDFPEKFTFHFSTSLGFNDQSTFNKDYLLYEGGKTDWLGIDDGIRDLPVEPATIPSLFTDNDRKDGITRSFNKIMAPSARNNFLDHKHAISVGNQVNFFGKPLGFIAGLSYSRKFRYYDDGEEGLYQLLGVESESLSKEFRFTDRKGNMDVLWGGMINLSYKFSNNHKLGLNIIHNHSGESSGRYLTGNVPSDGIDRNRETRTLQFLERSLTSGQLRGEHFFPTLAKLKLEWLGSMAMSRQYEPDLRFFTNSYAPDEPPGSQYEIRPSEYKVPARFYRDMDQTNFDNKLNFELPFNYLGLSSNFKFGTSYLYKERTFIEKRVDYKSQVSYYNGSVDDYLSDDNIGQSHPAWTTEQRYGLYIDDATDTKNSYDAEENVLGVYAMFDMPVISKLRAVFGVRYETTDKKSISKDPDKPVAQLNEQDWLPSINLTYSITDAMNLRLGYNRTLARPSFREFSYTDWEDYSVSKKFVGNPELKRTLIDNVDIRWELFMRPGENVSFSAFYKNFIDPIELVDDTRANNFQFTWKNADQARVYGFEVEFRKKLDFVNALKNLRIAGNFAYVRSFVSIDSLELISIQAYDPDARDTREMYGQAPYIVNGLLTYELEKVGFDANLSYNVTGPKLAVVMRGGTPNVFEQPRGLLNVKLNKKFGKRVKLTLSMKNILNPEHRFTYVFKDIEYIYSSFTEGRTYEIGFTYAIQ